MQYGVPLEVYVAKFSHTRFEPMGHTKNPDIRIAKSIVDYIFRWLGITFIPGYREAQSGVVADDASEGPGGKGYGAGTVGRVSDPASSPPSVGQASRLTNPPSPTATPSSPSPRTEAGRPAVSLPNGGEGSKSAPTSAKSQTPAQKNPSAPSPLEGEGRGEGAKNRSTQPKPKSADSKSPTEPTLLQRAGVALKVDLNGGPASQSEQFARFQLDAPSCDNCGSITVRAGNCYLCYNCGNSMGCS
jgi:ribonucleoside-diphosphate reductase alpha chain